MESPIEKLSEDDLMEVFKYLNTNELRSAALVRKE